MFRDALPRKALRIASELVEGQYAAWGFNGVESSSISNQLKIDPHLGTITAEKAVSAGVTVRRSESENLLEEFAIVEALLGYVSMTYSAWTHFRSRLIEISSTPLASALTATDISVLKLEYWDGFEFDGPANDADARLVLRNPDENIPAASIAGASLWHSNVGWIERCDGFDLLVNRNINTFDKLEEGQPTKRQMGIYTLCELRFGEASVAQADVFSLLDRMHDRSLSVFSYCLTEEVLESLGIKKGLQK
jgi:uncharacterized protein (TIGR04255 family)